VDIDTLTNVDDISFLQFSSIGNAMAYDLINGAVGSYW
jgi:hypothetical protein